MQLTSGGLSPPTAPRFTVNPHRRNQFTIQCGSVLLPHRSFAYHGAVGHRAYRIRLHGSG